MADKFLSRVFQCGLPQDYPGSVRQLDGSPMPATARPPGAKSGHASPDFPVRVAAAAAGSGEKPVTPGTLEALGKWMGDPQELGSHGRGPPVPWYASGLLKHPNESPASDPRRRIALGALGRLSTVCPVARPGFASASHAKTQLLLSFLSSNKTNTSSKTHCDLFTFFYFLYLDRRTQHFGPLTGAAKCSQVPRTSRVFPAPRLLPTSGGRDAPCGRLPSVRLGCRQARLQGWGSAENPGREANSLGHRVHAVGPGLMSRGGAQGLLPRQVPALHLVPSVRWSHRSTPAQSRVTE